MKRRGLIRVANSILLTLGAVWSMGVGGGAALFPQDSKAAAAAQRRPKPNILFVLTDDQRADTLWAMPQVRQKLVKKGVKFENGFVSNSLCCPSRASILTGRYSHGTGVYTNSFPNGGFDVFDDSSTIATWLDSAGYRTALMGKYLNQYKDPFYVPPGWDKWLAFTDHPGNGGSFYNYVLSHNGKPEEYGKSPRDYSTDVLAKKAARFIRTSDDPFFLYLSVYAPHGNTPARRHKGMFRDVHRPVSPSFNEEDVSDKPQWIQELPLIKWDMRKLRFIETLVAVDEAVDKLVTLLRRQGELKNTVIVFMSDNGKGWGEHRWTDKSDPYRGSTKVPFVIRFDRWIDEPFTSDELVMNTDLAPTFADLAGVKPDPGVGKSLRPLLRKKSSGWRSDFLLEHVEEKRGIPSYCGVRSHEWLYVAYNGGEEELYDLEVDPYELENLARRPAHVPILAEMRDRVQELCDPKPPGYDFPFPDL